MKSYISGIIAVVIAVGAFAFTAPTKKSTPPTNYDFFYKLSTFTEPQVETNSNWETASTACPTGSAKACKINVPDIYTHIDQSTGNRELNTSEPSNNVVIDAVMGTGTDFVPNVPTSTGLSSRLNRD